MPLPGCTSGRPATVRWTLAFLLTCLLFPATAFAADPPPGVDGVDGVDRVDDEEETRADDPPTLHEEIAVTATRSSLSLREAPGHVDVVTRDEIERQMTGDAADLVRYQPGVYAESDPTRLGVGGFSIRGIGGNRVLTRIDGVPVADGFDFTVLAIQRHAIDPEALERMEIVRSAVSTLYGSDALGGVVSLQTRDPRDYLLLGDGGPSFVGGRVGYDGRHAETATSLTLALGGDRWQGSLWGSYRDGTEQDNQGTVESLGASRTAPNPIDRQSTNLLGKVTRTGDGSFWRLAAELWDASAETAVLSSQGAQNLGAQFGPGVTYIIDTVDFDADDSQRRFRLSVEQTLLGGNAFYDQLLWRLYGQADETVQDTVEARETTIGGGFFGPVRTTPLTRDASFRFEQETAGFEAQLQKAFVAWGADHRLTYGAAVSRDHFDTLRDRVDVDPETGAEIPGSTPFPTKYFPESTTEEVGLFVQDEITLASGRLLLVPGLRWDRVELDPVEDDPAYLAGNPGTPEPVGLEESAVSPRLGVTFRVSDPMVVFAQYARGFKSPAYSEVNNGFSNFRFGYRTLPNPDLEPETSDNFELGLRWTTRRSSLSLTGFDNRYEDFIETVTAAVDPETGFIDFQPRNVASARIRGLEMAGDLRLDRWRLRTAGAWTHGEDEDDDRPLNTVAPPQVVLGLGYMAESGRWGTELASTFVASKDVDDVDRTTLDQFATPSYQLLDLTAFVELPGGFSLQGGVYNLLDETYWTWPSAQGLTQGSGVLDRYTSPGRSAALALRYRR